MIVDDTFANAILDALAGPGKASGLTATMYIALYDGDPTNGGAEVTGGGYARLGPVSMTSGTMWPAASGREKSNGAQIVGTPMSAPLAVEATWAVFVDTASGAVGVHAYAQQLPDAFSGGTGQTPLFDVGDVAIPLSDIGGV